MFIKVLSFWAPTGALGEGMSCEDHPLISADHPLLTADHPLFCDIIQMVLKGGAHEGLLMRGCPRGGAQEGVLKRGCSRGVCL